jgi:hypothetical protein
LPDDQVVSRSPTQSVLRQIDACSSSCLCSPRRAGSRPCCRSRREPESAPPSKMHLGRLHHHRRCARARGAARRRAAGPRGERPSPGRRPPAGPAGRPRREAPPGGAPAGEAARRATQTRGAVRLLHIFKIFTSSTSSHFTHAHVHMYMWFTSYNFTIHRSAARGASDARAALCVLCS